MERTAHKHIRKAPFLRTMVLAYLMLIYSFDIRHPLKGLQESVDNKNDHSNRSVCDSNTSSNTSGKYPFTLHAASGSMRDHSGVNAFFEGDLTRLKRRRNDWH